MLSRAMNQQVPDTIREGNLQYSNNLPAVNRKMPMRPGDDLMELLWQNGNVVIHSQNHRKVTGPISELNQVQKLQPAQKYEQRAENSSNLIEDDENALWFQYPLDDPLDKGFCLEFFSEMIGNNTALDDKISRNTASEEQENFKFSDNSYMNNVLAASGSQQCAILNAGNTLSPPKAHDDGFNRLASSLKNEPVLNFPCVSKPMKGKLVSSNAQLNKQSGCLTKVGGQESSMMTIGSSKCPSNHIVNDIGPRRTLSSGTAGVVAEGIREDAEVPLNSERVQNNVYGVTVTTSSSGSDYSVEKLIQKKTKNQNHKRKRREADDLGCHSEVLQEAEYESVEPKKPAKWRSRAAEVHNLAERRRRDRINEKMKTLQELIPQCNKTDKASMLDEAIEYVKSLQMQVQMMWMGGGMNQMIFPRAQQYFSGISMGLSHVPLPSAQNADQSIASSSTTTNQRVICPPSSLNMINFPNQMQRVFPESFGCYLGYQQMQPQSQAVTFNTYGSSMAQQNHSVAVPSTRILPSIEGSSYETFRNISG